MAVRHAHWPPELVLLRRMSFLNRMEMKRGDQSMTLTKRD
jgi:hypothetical protein